MHKQQRLDNNARAKLKLQIKAEISIEDRPIARVF